MKIMEVKRDTDFHLLCKGFPPEFEKYITYTRSLEYEQDPDYNMLKNLFTKVLNDEGLCFDHYYDWDSDRGTMTTADTNLNFAGRINFKNGENRQLNQINVEIVDNINNINENKEKSEKSNILNNNNKLNETKKDILETKIEEVKENEEEKENKEEEINNKNNIAKINNNENIINNNELLLSGVIPGQKRKPKRDTHVQCCIIM